MRFDFISFLIGFISAAILAGIVGLVLYRQRERIARAQQAVEQGAGATRRFFANTIEGRYYDFMVRSLNAYHLAGDVIPLASIYVEPHFLHPLPPPDPTEERAPSVFHVVPQIHDLPDSYAPYNVETLSVNDLRAGERHLALLGRPGSGKSVTLAVIGLVAAGEIELPAIDLMADEVFEAEIKDLPPDEREKRIRTRQETQQRALEQLRQVQRRDDAETEARSAVDLTTLLPVLVHLHEIDLRPEAYGLPADSLAGDKADRKRPERPLDPAEPVVAALQRRASGLAASTLPRLVYDRLTHGRALVLIDGFDDIPPSDRPVKLAWLRHFIEVYQANFIVVAGPETGYDPLLNLGLHPIFLRAWSDTDYKTLVRQWSSAWPHIVRAQRRGAAAMPDERTIRRVETANRGRLPIDVTLKTWAAFADDERELGRQGWYDFYVRQYVDTEGGRLLLRRIAAAQLDQGGRPLHRDQLKGLAAGGSEGKGDGKAGISDDVVNRVLHSGILSAWPGNTYTGAHALITAFLAAESLTPETVGAAAEKPSWALAMPFAAARLPLDEVVARRLAAPPDLLYTSLFSVVPWIVDAPANAAWRGEVFRRLTAALLAPSQFPHIRERAMAALISSRDKGALFVLRQALGHANPLVRRLGCIGLGALGESEPIKDLAEALGDENPDVQLAAGLALAAIGTDAALEEMVRCLFEGEQGLRRAVAEALAAIPGVGHMTLREAVANREDMMMRHAAVFGLARIKAAWSLALLYRTLLEDEQWYVRNAAEQAFREMDSPELGAVMRHPDADALTWLISWAADRGEGVPAGPNARQMLIRALQEADPIRRATAARTLADLGHVPALKPLYSALRDREEDVRSAVFDSLSSLQLRLGTSLPPAV